MMENRVTDDERSKNQDTGRKGTIVPDDAKDDTRLSKSVGNKRLREEPVGNKTRRKSVRNKRPTKSVGLVEELLPGIINDITLELITPKLSVRDLYILLSVSRSWQQAIQSHLVFKSRVRSHSQETLALVAHIKSRALPILWLYSSRDDTWLKLPSNRYLAKGFPHRGQCASLDGKLYMLGGFGKGNIGSRKIHALDLVGGRKWKKRADMLEPRKYFGCGVLNGKIYVFGGTSCGQYGSKCEVYDPKDNTWSPIKPMMTAPRFDQTVLTVGQEFFILTPNSSGEACAQVYNPQKDEWRLIKPFECHREGRMITAQGKFYLLNEAGIQLYSIDKHSLTNLQSYPAHAEDIPAIWLRTIVVDDELLVLVKVFTENTGDWSLGFLRSRGLCNEKKDTLWERATSGGPSIEQSKDWHGPGWLVCMGAIQI